MRNIILTRGKRALVDDEIFRLLQDIPFHAAPSRNGFFYARSNRTLLPGKPNTYLHWIVLAPSFHKSFQIHFKDGNTLNCQRDNLEYIEKSKNTQTSSKHQTARVKHSIYLGVTKTREKWSARVKVGGKLLYLGRFNTEVEAAKKYNEFVIEKYGPSAKVNQL